VHHIEKNTTNFVYFRWGGNTKQIKGKTGNIEKERREDTRNWAAKIKALLVKIEVFGFFSK
jgi:hypothetical protein